MSEQRCETCKFRKPYTDSVSGKPMNGESQPCTWNGKVPFYVMNNRWVYEDEGKDCPTWHAK